MTEAPPLVATSPGVGDRAGGLPGVHVRTASTPLAKAFRDDG